MRMCKGPRLGKMTLKAISRFEAFANLVEDGVFCPHPLPVGGLLPLEAEKIGFGNRGRLKGSVLPL